MINITLNVSFLLLNFTIIVFNYYFSLNLQLFDLNNIYNKFSLIELNNFPFFMACKKCYDIPEINLKDKQSIIITCKNCNITKDENLENISNYSSEWITNEPIYYCDLEHKEKVISFIFCKECDRFLCKNCLISHNKNLKNHNLIKTKDLKIGFCNNHNEKYYYYCDNCDSELCKKCQNCHNSHNLIKLENGNIEEIINIAKFEKLLEKAEIIKKEKYLITNQIKAILENTFTKDKESTNLLHNIIYDIVNEFYRDLKIEGNLTFFAKILFVSIKKMNKWKDFRVKQYQQILQIINKFFDKEEMAKFNNIINEKRDICKFLLNNLSNQDENNIINDIENLFKYTKDSKFQIYIESFINNYNSVKERLLEIKRIKNMPLQEKNKRKEQLNQICKRQKESRAKANYKSYTKEEETKKLNQTIEDMSIMGSIIKDQIIEEKETNPEKFIPIEEATKTENKDNSLFIMGLLAQNLENQGITTAIEREPSKNDQDLSNTTLQFMMNGMATQKKFDFHFDLGKERNEQLLNDKNEQNKFNEKLKKKLAKEYNIKEDDIIISFPQRGSYQITVIFKSKDFYELKKEKLLEKFKDEPELGKLKDLHTNLLMNGCKISQKMFDSRGNNKDGGWGENEKRGGEDYIPPKGWIRYGLNVLGKYDKNDDWLSYDGRKGEWCIAYHGVAQSQNSNEVKKVVNLIAKHNLKKGSGQYYKDYIDCRHPPNKVGEGVYCTPNPEVVIKDNYAGIAEVNNEKYYMAYMLRVNPAKIRCAEEKKDYWVLNGNENEIRPYGILIKKV